MPAGTPRTLHFAHQDLGAWGKGRRDEPSLSAGEWGSSAGPLTDRWPRSVRLDPVSTVASDKD